MKDYCHVLMIPIRLRNILYKPKHRYLMKISNTNLKRDLNFNKDII